MILRPLHDRVLIKPIEAPTMTQSGLHLAEDAKPDQMGTVVAVGTISNPRQEEAEAAADELMGRTYGDAAHPFRSTAELLRSLVHRESCVSVGDTVLFSWSAGQEIWMEDDGERYLLMRESDLLAVIEEEMVCQT
jgi:co-chaperonin GroES (HSP10)